jgi:predicted ATPase
MPVVITVGCPGSGKTTHARELQRLGYINVCFDDLRIMFAGSRKDWWHNFWEDRDAGSRLFLRNAYSSVRDHAVAQWPNVVLSGTNITADAGIYADMLKRTGRELQVKVFQLPLEELYERDRNRHPEERVPHEVIDKFYRLMNAPDAWWRAHVAQ